MYFQMAAHVKVQFIDFEWWVGCLWLIALHAQMTSMVAWLVVCVGKCMSCGWQ
jgi:hypothetical protein